MFHSDMKPVRNEEHVLAQSGSPDERRLDAGDDAFRLNRVPQSDACNHMGFRVVWQMG